MGDMMANMVEEGEHGSSMSGISGAEKRGAWQIFSSNVGGRRLASSSIAHGMAAASTKVASIVNMAAAGGSSISVNPAKRDKNEYRCFEDLRRESRRQRINRIEKLSAAISMTTAWRSATWRRKNALRTKIGGGGNAALGVAASRRPRVASSGIALRCAALHPLLRAAAAHLNNVLRSAEKASHQKTGIAGK